jgi:uncharacterized membrane protein
MLHIRVVIIFLIIIAFFYFTYSKGYKAQLMKNNDNNELHVKKKIKKLQYLCIAVAILTALVHFFEIYNIF